MSNIEKIRQEIERRIKACKTKNGFPAGTICAIRIETYEGLLSFIDTLLEEKPSEDLEEEVKRYYSDNFTYISSDQPTLSILTNVARHFANWQKEQMMKDAVEDALLLERAWLTLDGLGHEELAGRIRQFAERKGLIWK